jgi:hypothetical protein
MQGRVLNSTGAGQGVLVQRNAEEIIKIILNQKMHYDVQKTSRRPREEISCVCRHRLGNYLR